MEPCERTVLERDRHEAIERDADGEQAERDEQAVEQPGAQKIGQIEVAEDGRQRRDRAAKRDDVRERFPGLPDPRLSSIRKGRVLDPRRAPEEEQSGRQHFCHPHHLLQTPRHLQQAGREIEEQQGRERVEQP